MPRTHLVFALASTLVLALFVTPAPAAAQGLPSCGNESGGFLPSLVRPDEGELYPPMVVGRREPFTVVWESIFVVVRKPSFVELTTAGVLRARAEGSSESGFSVVPSRSGPLQGTLRWQGRRFSDGQQCIQTATLEELYMADEAVYGNPFSRSLMRRHGPQDVWFCPPRLRAVKAAVTFNYTLGLRRAGKLQLHRGSATVRLQEACFDRRHDPFSRGGPYPDYVRRVLRVGPAKLEVGISAARANTDPSDWRPGTSDSGKAGLTVSSVAAPYRLAYLKSTRRLTVGTVTVTRSICRTRTRFLATTRCPPA